MKKNDKKMLVTQSVGTIVMRRIMLDNFQTIEVSNSRTLPIGEEKQKRCTVFQMCVSSMWEYYYLTPILKFNIDRAIIQGYNLFQR